MTNNESEQKYNGPGIYGLYDVMNNKIYIGKSVNVASRFEAHKMNFLTKSDANPMYQEPLENFVFMILYKIPKDSYKRFGDMMESLFISLALSDFIPLYNRQKVSRDATISVLYAFGLNGKVKDEIKTKTGHSPSTIKMMNQKTRKKLIEQIKKR